MIFLPHKPAHHGSAARISVWVGQGSSVDHGKLLRVDVFTQLVPPGTYKQEVGLHVRGT